MNKKKLRGISKQVMKRMFYKEIRKINKEAMDILADMRDVVDDNYIKSILSSMIIKLSRISSLAEDIIIINVENINKYNIIKIISNYKRGLKKEIKDVKNYIEPLYIKKY